MFFIDFYEHIKSTLNLTNGFPNFFNLKIINRIIDNFLTKIMILVSFLNLKLTNRIIHYFLSKIDIMNLIFVLNFPPNLYKKIIGE